MEWVSVKDQPFPKDGNYFICLRNDFPNAVIVQWEEWVEWEEGRLIDENDDFFHPNFCNYWIPIPEAPLEDDPLNKESP